MTQVLHALFGISRPDREYPHRCSKCGREIAEREVPLMLWGDQGRLMWVICEGCEVELIPVLAAQAFRS